MSEERGVFTQEAFEKIMVMISSIINQLAVNLHNWYEEAAKEAGWKTQGSCQVPFDQLPQANKEVMLKVAGKAFDWVASKKWKEEVEEMECPVNPPEPVSGQLMEGEVFLNTEEFIKGVKKAQEGNNNE